jgi:PAN domain
MHSLNGRTLFLSLLAVLGMSAACLDVAKACSCKAHFEILDPKVGSFKPDVPVEHFEAHQTRRKGETNNQCRRRAREAAQSCMKALWRDRWRLQNKEIDAAPECKKSLTELTSVIRPSSVWFIDIKAELERAACCGESPWAKDFKFPAKVNSRTYGDPGCGPQLFRHESRGVTDYVLDCKSVRARENCGRVELSEADDEVGFDRLGMDLPDMPIRDVTSARGCRSRCITKDECRSWTWVKPGFHSPDAECWLKGGIPWASKNDCCLSGTVK